MLLQNASIDECRKYKSRFHAFFVLLRAVRKVTVRLSKGLTINGAKIEWSSNQRNSSSNASFPIKILIQVVLHNVYSYISPDFLFRSWKMQHRHSNFQRFSRGACNRIPNILAATCLSQSRSHIVLLISRLFLFFARASQSLVKSLEMAPWWPFRKLIIRTALPCGTIHISLHIFSCGYYIHSGS